MAIIDLTIERPAWKRVEYGSESTERGDEIREVEPLEDEDMDDETTSSSGRFSMRRMVLMAAMAVVIIMAARTLRSRFGGEDEM